MNQFQRELTTRSGTHGSWKNSMYQDDSTWRLVGIEVRNARG